MLFMHGVQCTHMYPQTHSKCMTLYIKWLLQVQTMSESMEVPHIVLYYSDTELQYCVLLFICQACHEWKLNTNSIILKIILKF